MAALRWAGTPIVVVTEPVAFLLDASGNSRPLQTRRHVIAIACKSDRNFTTLGK